MTEVDNWERYISGVLVRYGDKRNQSWRVSWNQAVGDFTCACQKNRDGELCWHRDEVVTQLAIQALQQRQGQEGKVTSKNVNKRKLKFDDGK